MPKRIQRKRTRGWRMPENTVYVGRPTKWGNPFVIEKDGDAWKVEDIHSNITEWFSFRYEAINAAVEMFDLHSDDVPDVSELRGKDLACWCPLDQPCHADVLLRLVNKE